MRFTKILCTAGVIALAALGAQLVAAQVAAAHTPSASVTCTTWSLAAQSYNAAQNNTYGYSVDGAAEVTGTFASGFSKAGTFAAGSGNHTLVAHVYANNAPPPAQYSKTYNLSASGCVTSLPIPAAPQPTGPTCSDAGAATIPADTDTVHWSLNGNVATATAQGGNHFTDGTTTKSFTETVLPKLSPSSDDCAVHLTVQAPAFADGDCDTAPSLTGATEGTGYTASTDGTPGFGNTVTVTFTATPNYRLDGQRVYTFRYAAQPDCRTASAPVTPAVTQATCDHTTGLDSGFSITPATTDGIGYSVDGLLVTATATDGHKLGALPNGWTSISDTVATYLATQSDPECVVDVSPVAPGITQSTCAASGTSAAAPTLTVVETPNISYALPLGPYAAPSTVIVTATAASGYEFTSAGLPAGWSLVGSDSIAATATYSVDFAAAPLCGTAAAATFLDNVCRADGAAGGSYTLVSSTDVEYYVDGIETAAGTYPAADGSTVTITAQPRTGYTLVGTTSWSHSFSAVPNCAHVSGGHFVKLPPAGQPTAIAATTVPLASTGVPTMSLLLIAGLLALVGGVLCIGGVNHRRPRG
jgi:hypothetical protein